MPTVHDANYWSTPKGRYFQHRNSAKRRKIEWKFTFEEWWTIWEPHWALRGCKDANGLVMCRHEDVGPYATDNVYLDTVAGNVSNARRIQSS